MGQMTKFNMPLRRAFYILEVPKGRSLIKARTRTAGGVAFILDL
jgi:hypothetical protein